MGRESRNNPTAIAAKNGELSPKKKPMSKAERDALLLQDIMRVTQLDKLYKAMGEGYKNG